MTKVDEFSHGYAYGDYSGVIFHGPPADGVWLDCLSVSNCYIAPLFCGILDRAWRESGGEQLPRLVSDWNALEGWMAADGPVPVAPTDAAELAQSLVLLGPADVTKHCVGCTVGECLRCAGLIREFIGSRLDHGVDLFIEHA